MKTHRLLTVAAGALLLAAGCAKRVEVVQQPAGSVAPAIVVEQFLRAANAAAANDSNGVVVMGRLLGNKNGPVSEQWPRDEVNQRMFLTANLLKHDNAQITGEQLVPGRLNEAKLFNVELTIAKRKTTVPFIMVLGKGDRWLVECIELERLTNPNAGNVRRCG
jgi:hypothetical protein